MRVEEKKVWYVDFPTYQYNEDVKVLARESNLSIVDSRFKSDPTTREIATDTPKLTIKGALEPLKEPTEEPKKRGRPKKA